MIHRFNVNWPLNLHNGGANFVICKLAVGANPDYHLTIYFYTLVRFNYAYQIVVIEICTRLVTMFIMCNLIVMQLGVRFSQTES